MAYMDNKKKTYENEDKINLSIPIDMMDGFLIYIFLDNPLINKKSLINLKKLLSSINEQEYANDFERLFRIKLLKTILTGQLENNLMSFSLLREYCIKELSDEYSENIEMVFSELENEPTLILNDDEVIFLNEYVQEILTNMHLFQYSSKVEECINELKTTSNNLNKIKMNNVRFENVIENLYRDIKNVKATSKYVSLDFNLDTPSAETVVSKTISELKKPSNYIRTGIKELNVMLDGGFENGRTYLFFGLPKSFKSGLLLNLSAQCCKYNKITPKDTTKKPAILYLTQENSIRETIQRLFFWATGDNIKYYSTEEALKIIRDEVYKETGTVLLIKYRPNKSISTTDLESMVNDIKLEGYEVSMIVQDYTKRIRSSRYNPDLRIELGQVVDDFTVLAKNLDIPIVSAGQLNREAFRILENALEKGRHDIGKFLNASHVGESALMIENTDYGIILNREYSESLDKYFISFKLIASRAKDPKKTYFAQPFINGFRIADDCNNVKSLGIDNITEIISNEFNPNEGRKELFKKKESNIVEQVQPTEIKISKGKILDNKNDMEIEDVGLDDLLD